MGFNNMEPLWLDGNSTMDCREYYRLHGKLTKERLEWLLENQAKDPEDVTPYISEAMGCFMPEDFLHNKLVLLQGLAKSLRGSNKEELISILAIIESTIQEQVGQSEYGISELKVALSELEE